MPDDELAKQLYDTTDAMVWAEEWCRIARKIQERGEEIIDAGWMVGWFANAMATAEFHSKKPHAPVEDEVVVLPRTALFEFLGEVALPPWQDESGEWIGANIDCAPIAQRLSEWVDYHDMTGLVEIPLREDS